MIINHSSLHKVNVFKGECNIKPKVSIVIPIYNVENYLEETLESIVNQTLKDIEIILVDDGSTDDSYKIIQFYSMRDNRVRTIQHKNMGQSVARNNGVRISTGEYIYFMDSDDLLELNALEICYQKSKEEDLDLLTFDGKIFSNTNLNDSYYFYDYNRKEKLYPEVKNGINFLTDAMSKNAFFCSPCLHFIKHEYFKKTRLEFYPGIIHEDELFIFLLNIEASRINYLPDILFYRRIRPNSTMTKIKSIHNINGYITVCKELLSYINIVKDNSCKVKLLRDRIEILSNEILGLLENFSRKERNKIINNMGAEYKNILTLRGRLKLNYLLLFKVYRKIDYIFKRVAIVRI